MRRPIQGEVASAGRVLFLPGNGHSPMRLEQAREVLASCSPRVELVELAYGQHSGARFGEGARAGGSGKSARTYDALLADLEAQIAQIAQIERAGPADLVYATGIGGLVALSLRARGALRDQPVILQGAVLWGLEQRLFPRLMRLPGMPHALALALRTPLVQRRFVRRHLRSAPDAAWRRRFFAGYADAAAFAEWFAWLRPELLRRLEQELDAAALTGCEAWWGDQETVVGLEELRVTEAALGVSLPLRRFRDWGHYPMIDDPKGWAQEIRHAVATARRAS